MRKLRTVGEKIGTAAITRRTLDAAMLATRIFASERRVCARTTHASGSEKMAESQAMTGAVITEVSPGRRDPRRVALLQAERRGAVRSARRRRTDVR
jgi:hypothetical protein